MKYTLTLLLSAALLCTTQTQAQPFIGLSTGVVCGKGGDLGSLTMDDGSAYTQTRIRGSYGSGIPTEFMFGYMFSNYGFFGTLAYFCGFNTLADKYEGPSFTSWQEVTSKQLSFNPNFIVRTNCDGPIDGYARAGVSIPLMTNVTTHQVNESSGTINFEQIERTKLGLNMGCIGAAGVDLSLGEKLTLFGEVGGTTISQDRRSREITLQEIGGVDNLDNLSTAQRQTNFVRELTNTSNTPSNSNFDSDQPLDALTSSAPLTRGGVMLGVRFTF